MTETRKQLERRFDAACLDLHRRSIKPLGYTPRRFMRMLQDHGGVEAARRLIHTSNPGDGFTRAWEVKRLDLTVEALVVEQNDYHALFTGDEIARARARLKQYGYVC